MMFELEFEKIHGFSNLFCDFLKGKPFLLGRLRNELELFRTPEIIEKKLKSYTKRKKFLEVIRESNSDIELTEQQKENLKILMNENALVVITGQQPAIFGGPLYTLYKSISAIELSRRLKETYPEFDFVPVFWLEDNDHDYQEATQVFLLDKFANPLAPDLKQLTTSDNKRSIADIPIDKAIIDFLEFYFESNNLIAVQPKLASQILNFCKADVNLPTPFKKILNLALGNYGMLFLSASLCRKHHAFAEIIRKEIEQVGVSHKIIESANRLIEGMGYHIQAKSFDVNAFYHLNGERIKIQFDKGVQKYKIKDTLLTGQELLRLFEENPANFSPNVLLRPICQDFIVPTVASVLGPSEIGYTTQLPELYEWFSVVMPAIIPRHSITFVPAKFASKLVESGIEFFFQKPETFEKTIYEQNRDQTLLETIENLEARFKAIFNEMQEVASQIDRTLVASSEAHFSKSFRSFAALKEKIFSRERRKILEQSNSLILLNKYIFPKGTLQERIVATIYPLLLFEAKEFLNKIEGICSRPKDRHYIVVV